MIGNEGRIVNVHPFSAEYAPTKGIPIATVATLWTDPKDGNRYILIINEALYFGDKLPTTLLNPNQMRANGVKVQDVPRQFDPRSDHSILVPRNKIRIPLELKGIVSGFQSVRPTIEMVDRYPHIELTSDVPWDPNSAMYAEREMQVASVNHNPVTRVTPADNEDRLVGAIASYRGLMAQEIHSVDDLATRLIASVNVVAHDIQGDGFAALDDNECQEQRTIAGLATVATTTSERSSVLTPAILARRWGIGLEAAKRTMLVTTQTGIRNVLAPGERKIRQRLNHLNFPNLKGQFFTDTMFAQVKSTRGYTAAQVFTDGRGFDHIYPIKGKGHAAETLINFIQDVGIPQTIISDNAPEEISGKFAETCRKYRIKQEQTVPYSPWHNLAEASIRELKVGIRRALRRKRMPKRLWCYAAKWVAAVRRLTALDLPKLEGRVPEERVLGSTPDISQHALFDLYEVVRYLEPTASFPHEKKLLGRFLGVAEAATDIMAFYVLTSKGTVVIRKSLWALSDDDNKDPDMVAAIVDLNIDIIAKIGDAIDQQDMDPTLTDDLPEAPEYIFDSEENVDPVEPEATMLDADDFTPEAYDQYLLAEVLLPQGGELRKAKVSARVRDKDGLPVGKRHSNPLLDTREYEVTFPDGSTEAMTANTIAESIYAQTDQEGRSYSILSGIVDHRNNGHAVSKDDGFTTDRRGVRHPKKTTRGWDLQVEWKDGTTSWIPLKDIKESNPVETAEYAVNNKIAEEPAFAWWTRQVLRKRDRIIKKVKTRYWKKTHKFGIELPKSVAEALAIDARTGTDFWRKAIEKEMKNVMPAFEFLDDNEIPKFHKHIDLHMIFDIKMDLTRKARLVAGGHQTDEPKESTYSSVVSRDSVRLAFMLAALNDLDILSADVQNAYLNAPTKEKVYTTAGLEFGPTNAGRPVLIVRALYGLKSSGARWRDHMANTLREANFVGCKADPDVWMRPNVKPNGDKYWEYVLVYVDDVLVMSHDPKAVMTHLETRYTLKAGSVKEPDAYLGAEVKKHYVQDSDDPSKVRWSMSSDLYVKRSVAEVERELLQVGDKLRTRVTTPMSAGYRPEVDVSTELDAKRANYYQGLIGVLRWICELGRIDILIDVAQLSRFTCAPRQGHLEQVFHVFAYLKNFTRSTMVFDDTMPSFDGSRFQPCDWSEYYPGAQEVLPPNAPEERGKQVRMTCYVDADHAGCRVTRRSHTGIIIFVNRAPILWYSKRQNTVETSTFGSEFIAMKTAVEMSEGLRYKLRMMGVPIDGPTTVFCDNDTVVTQTTKPESVLKKKHNAIAYHRVREAQAAKIVQIAWEPGDTNLADLLTKSLPGPRLRELIAKILW